ncbi:flavin-containing monooxygenase [Leucobacter komagatae]|uniref:flavin-containing monooxygenase n=1 Tax=Leucobacter komagatae TaxID=55969 RepID=UPI0005AC08FE|nr:NAD(P)/FAD-dependent oxidoreductase [Leucobacter komagatae]
MDQSQAVEHLDVAIIGAGISGIAAAVEVRRTRPDLAVAILEMRDGLGGTWDLFRFPGIRSDSDMYTLGYSFKPWVQPQAIASGDAILGYLQETVDEFSLGPLIRFGHRLTHASWDSTTNRWTLTFSRADGETTLTASQLYLGTGYFSYRGGYNPPLPGEDAFRGEVIHPQEWPADLDVTGKRVAVIGSGATAITLVPSLATVASHVTMIQRSPGYIHVSPDEDEEANELRATVGASEAFTRVRLRNLTQQQDRFASARKHPEEFAAELFRPIEEIVGEAVRKAHFTPAYAPWDQRVCLAPNGDIFHAIREGGASVATGEIERVTPDGVRMRDGSFVAAEIIVKATGLTLNVVGDAAFVVDGELVDFNQTLTYKGMAFSGVPNLVAAFGFLNSSWTLRLELVNEYWMRILSRMGDVGAERFTPVLREQDLSAPTRPFLADMTSGYIRRGVHLLPRQGNAPWVYPQTWGETLEILSGDPVSDDTLAFEPRPRAEAATDSHSPAAASATASPPTLP